MSGQMKITAKGIEVWYAWPGTPMVELSPGVVLPERFSVNTNFGDYPYAVDFEAVLEGDRFVCESLRCRRRPGEDPVTTEGLREIPVARLLRIAAERLLAGPDGKDKMRPAFPRVLEDGPTNDALLHVAGMYRLAQACGEPPTKAVEDRFNLARSTAGRWISMARRKGLLSPTTPGKAAG